MLGCRTRKRVTETVTIKKDETVKVDSNILKVQRDSIFNKIEIKKDAVKKVNDNSGDIIIKGKTDSIKPFDFHNIVNGDTLSSIHISGKADFKIVNHWNKKEEIENSSNIESNLNIIAKVARTAVAKETIKKLAKKVVDNKTEVKATGFQWPIYLISGVILLAAVLLYIIIQSYKK